MVAVQSHKIIREFEEKVNSLFGRLTFKPETHEYFVGTTKVPKSVSALVKGYVIPTDFNAIAASIDKRQGLPAGTTSALWAVKNKKACVDGSDTHDFAENKETLIADTKKKEAVLAFWQDLELEFPGRYFIVAKETRMYHLKYFFSGTDDVTLYDRWENAYILVDYKTNEDLFKNYKGNTLAEPFTYLLDCPYNHYQIQLSFYQILMEQLGFKVLERWVIWLLPDGTHKLYKTENLTVDLTEQLEANHYA